MLAKREPKIVELAKQALMLRGSTASVTSLQFVKDLVLLLQAKSFLVVCFLTFRSTSVFHQTDAINILWSETPLQSI